MNYSKFFCLIALAGGLVGAYAPAFGAQDQQAQDSGQSIELGNVDDATVEEPPAASPSSSAPGSASPVASSAKPVAGSADTGTDAPTKKADTPQERYRDAKLLQAAGTTNADGNATPTGNHATYRKYLKISREAYQDAISSQ